MDGGHLGSTIAFGESKTPQFGYFTDSRHINFYIPEGGNPTPSLPGPPQGQATKENPTDLNLTKMTGFKVQSLWPQTPVYSSVNIDRAAVNQPFVKVAVQETDGGLVWGWVMRKFLRKGLKRNDERPQGKRFTGVTYGDYKFNSVAVSLQDMHFVTGESCATCHMGRSDHRVYETEEARAFVKSLIQIHLTGGGKSRIMVGALCIYVFGQDAKPALVLVAESGFQNALEKAAGVAAKQATFPVEYANWSELVTLHYKNCLGNPIFVPSGSNQESTIAKGQTAFDCAAPKMIQYYIHKHMASFGPIQYLYMSEMFCPGAEDIKKPPPKSSIGAPKIDLQKKDTVIEQDLYPYGAAAESCNRCRKSIPPMLCGNWNWDKIKPRTRNNI